jgi:transcriptional regulator with XRE-family HTH domain
VELAKRLRTPQTVVSSYERGQHRVAVLELMRYAKALEIDPRGLFAEIVAKFERR